ncbi:hypothetical protein O1L60_15140 [Streptomyces diastatochromogenes]|nr:hypothetical protein [Streptomyces diastatochromogenes]
MVALIVGLILLWTSDAWDQGTKVLATALTLATPVVVVLGGLFLAARFGPTELLTILAMGIVLPATAAVRLFRTARPQTA